MSDTYNLLQKQKYPCKFTDLGDFFFVNILIADIAFKNMQFNFMR